MSTGYDTRADLPTRVKQVLPAAAQEVWRMAYNSACAQERPDPTAYAWAAVDMGWNADFDGRDEFDKYWDESKHPRGKTTAASTPGSFAPAGDEGPGVAEHPGEGYSKDAKLLNGVILTPHVDDAVLALQQGKRVELDQVRKVSVLLDRLGEVSKDMIERGENAPKFDLCNVTVRGTNLFCAGSRGVPRIEMPQIPVAQNEAFIEHLKGKGYTVKPEEQFASHLRATQNELDGRKVASIADRIRRGESRDYDAGRIFVSDDDYILDGHHRWAAKIGLDAADGTLRDDMKMRINRVDIDINELLYEADVFTGGKGKLGFGEHRIKKKILIEYELRKWDESEHPRGKTTDASTPGSFAPREGMVIAPADRDEWPTHIRKLVIPPAWTEVQYSEDPDDNLLAVGRDAKGRAQYVYSQKWAESQAEAKFAKTRELNEKFDAMYAQVLRDAKAGNPNAQAAAVVFETGIRPGSDAETGAAKQAYGATTLEGRHVLYNGKRLKFTGKSGKDLYINVNDPKVADMLFRRKEATTPKGRIFPEVSDDSLRDYVKTLNGGGFRTKDIRTAIGTRTAEQVMDKMRAPKTLKDYKKAVRTIGKKVAEVLGNTPTVALQSYIDPTLFGGWRRAARV